MSTWICRLRVPGLCLAAGLGMATGAAAVVTFNVDSTLDQIDDDTSDGVCHTAADTCTLRAAVMEANLVTGEEARILLPAGTYVLALPASGGNGPDSGDLNLNPPSSGNPVLSIVGAGRSITVIDADQIDRVFSVDSGRTASLADVTLRNGFASLGDGGGIANRGELFLYRCAVSGNEGGNGGGIANFRSLYLFDSTIHGNSAQLQGGGIFNDFGTLLVRTEVNANLAFGGGGLANHGALNSQSSTISSNTSHGDGGGIYSPGAEGEDLTLIQSTVSGNSADGSGGGLYFGSPPQFNANVFSSTIAWNGADADADPDGGNGGGVYVAAGSNFHLRNTLVAGNTLVNQPIYNDCWGTLNSYGTNILGAWKPSDQCIFVFQSGNAGILNSLDSLGPLLWNGGPTRTVALLPGSNAIDSGDPELGCIGPDLEEFATDQRGAPRVFGAHCDVGAYEAGTLFFDGFESRDLSAW